MSLDSRLLRPICSNSSSASCALVSAGVSKLSTEMSIQSLFLVGADGAASATLTGTQCADQRTHDRLYRSIDLLFGQGGVCAVERQAYRQTFLKAWHDRTIRIFGGFGAINVEQGGIAQQAGRGRGPNGAHQGCMGDLFIHQHGNIALNALMLGHSLE